ncbi:tetratricopeptide repeat protein [Candidatus Haliotispira prima]|uniref:Tetratricopeptide repeat protein n=1 Tax=Candidatus Haliotispira prima TaxID=3034016 RepID=A0ABY8MFH9_9SPIO|nr:tetratricopeptide repeat protein [Candidatus Haliotispira prima]
MNRQFAERYYNIATDYYNDKDYKRAVSYYDLALKQDRNLKVIHLNYGLALIEVRDYEKAEQQLLRSYGVDARNTLCLSALGYLNFRAEKYDTAATWYRRSIAINEYNPQTYYNLGIVEQRVGDYEASQKAFDKVTELQPANNMPKELRRFSALNELYLGNEEKSMVLYEEYFSESSSNEKVFQDAYDFYTGKDLYEKVPEVFKLFEKSLSNTPLASYLLAELYYLKLNNPVLGQQNLKVAIQRGFRDQERLENLVRQLKGSQRSAAQKLLDRPKQGQ